MPQSEAAPPLHLRLLDLLMHALHLSVIGFFLVGWLLPSLLLWHFLLSLSILFSWLVLGYFFGFGYCLITDLQWRLKASMGEQPETPYYVKYMLNRCGGAHVPAHLSDAVTTWLFFGVLIVSTGLMAGRFIG